MTAATLTAADAGADLGTALRCLADRFEGVTSPDELREFTDEAAALVRRARGRLRTLTRRAEVKQPAASEPEPEPKVIRIGPDGPLEMQPPAPAERPASPPAAEAHPEPPRPLEPARAVAADPPAVRPAAPQPAPAATTPPRRPQRSRPVAAALTIALLTVAAVCGAWTTTARTTARAARATGRATGRGLRRAARWARRRLAAGNHTAGSRP